MANSTVFGGIAGDSLAARITAGAAPPEPDSEAVEAAATRALAPLGRPAGDLNGLRERLLDLMWDDVGIIRDCARLEGALDELAELADEVETVGVGGGHAFNPAWQERLNLENQILVGRAIATAALARTDSRGAHFRADFPTCGSLSHSANTLVRLGGDGLAVSTRPVAFTRLRPDEVPA